MTTEHLNGSLRPSLNAVLRSLKRRENSLYNCINSIASDAKFVRDIGNLYPALPVCANLRCGLWYTPNPDDTCYFKSTDGHYGNWSFSVTRLNWHIALLAAQKGGCIIVDATRRGKVFPDALTKTIPIWAAVVNRAVHALRLLKWQADEGCKHNEHMVCTCQAATRCSAHSRPEAEWDQAVHLPAWISRNEQARIEERLGAWVDSLLEAGVALEGLAVLLRKPLQPLWISQQSTIWLNEIPTVDELGFTPLFLVSASAPIAHRRHTMCSTEGDSSFEYVPGAGDDEESWAKGLTPQLFWQNYQVLVAAGQHGVEEVAQQLARAAQASPPTRASPAMGQPVFRDAHHPAVQGCITVPPSDRALLGAPCSIGETGIALGNLAAGAPPQVWNRVNAVLNVGAVQHSGMRQVGGQQDDRYLWLPIPSSKQERHALEDALPNALAFLFRHLGQGHRVLVHCHEGTNVSVCVALAALLCCFSQPQEDGECKLETPFQQNIAPQQAEERDHQSSTGAESSATAALDSKAADQRRLSTQEGEPGCASACYTETKGTRVINRRNQMYREVARSEPPDIDRLSKSQLRQRLAFLSAYYPASCPSRGNLRQVFSFASWYTVAGF